MTTKEISDKWVITRGSGARSSQLFVEKAPRIFEHLDLGWR
jgi:hypothetical protein